MNMFDEARSIASMMRLGGMTQSKVAKILGRSQPYVANKERLLKYTETEMTKIIEYGLSERHARTILRIEDSDLRLEAIERAHKMRMNVARCEIMVDSMLDGLTRDRIRSAINYTERINCFERALESSISMLKEFGIKAYLKRDESFGKIYFSVCIN